MPNVCYFTGKRTRFGRKKAYSGQRIQKGGFGLKTSGIARRTFKPNLQKVTAVIVTERKAADGTVEVTRTATRLRACTRAIRSGMVVKPLKRKYGYTRQQKQSGNA